MKTPPLLVGAALLFWGWQTELLIPGAIMAVILESARFVKARCQLSNEDFSRIWTFCAVLFLATAAYGFTAGSGPARVSEWVSTGRFAAGNAVGNATATTAVLMIRWLPMVYFLFVAAEAYSDRDGIPLETISLILRRRWKKALQTGQPPPKSRSVDVTYPYFVACLFAASGHPVTEADTFFWGLCALLAWVFWSRRSRRFAMPAWAGTMGAAVLMAYGGQRGLVQLRHAIDQFNPSWFTGGTHQVFDALESRTEIGQIGRIKTSRQIVIRLETPTGGLPPAYLREASYRTYRSAIWYAGGATNDFAPVDEQPLNSGTWLLLPGKTNSDTVTIACYVPGGKAVLPLPPSSGLLQQLPDFEITKNSVGAVRAEGPGLAIFNARYGPGATMDAPPDTNDLAVPEREKPALDEIKSELHLTGQSREEALQTISRYFAAQFAYSLWQEPPRVHDTNSTALGRFLLKSRSGHCEYFATATVLLLRESGIPARYTVGYAVHETSGNKTVVRQNDAHAWCRVWNAATQNWEDFDTTPGTWLAMEHQHDSAFQFLSDAWSRVVFEFSKFRWGQSQFRQYIFWALVPILGLLLYQIVFRSGKRRLLSNARTAPNDILRRGLDSEFYQLESELAKRGFVRHFSEPASVWLRRIAMAPELCAFRESLLGLINLHYRHRFDPQGLNEQDRETLRREARLCVSHIASRT